MGGCITSALTDASAVEVVGAVLGTVSSRPRGAPARATPSSCGNSIGWVGHCATWSTPSLAWLERQAEVAEGPVGKRQAGKRDR